MRKAVRLWVSRARVRKGLRRQVIASAQKGRDVVGLLRMMDEAESDDLANTILARDSEGCTPLLWAAKKGFVDVVDAFLSAAGRCATELGDETLLGSIVNTPDSDGNTALHWAARKGFEEVAASLIE